MNTEQNKTRFSEMYLELHPQLEKYCMALMFDREDVKDLMSDTITIAFQKYGDMREPDKFKQFLFGIASNLFKKRISRKRQYLSIEASGISKHLHSEYDASLGADVSNLYAAMETLPDNEKEIIALFELSGFSLAEISVMMNMNINTVKTQLSRGRKRLCKILNPAEEIIK